MGLATDLKHPMSSPWSGRGGPEKAPGRHRPLWLQQPGVNWRGSRQPPAQLPTCCLSSLSTPRSPTVLLASHCLSLLSFSPRHPSQSPLWPFWVLPGVVTFSSVFLLESCQVPQLGMTPVIAEWGRDTRVLWVGQQGTSRGAQQSSGRPRLEAIPKTGA